MSGCLRSCDIVPCPFSDHCALLLSSSIPDVIPPGHGLWKLNTSILCEDKYYDLIATVWCNWRSLSLTSLLLPNGGSRERVLLRASLSGIVAKDSVFV